MDTNEPFLQHWFSGVNKFLDCNQIQDVEPLLETCSIACSESYSRGVYRRAFSIQFDSIDEPLNLLHKLFTDFEYEIYEDKIMIIYSRCECDLVKKSLITSTKLCKCSEKSLLYNWEYVFGIGNIKVRNVSSILKKDHQCMFEVKVRQLGHFS